MDEQEQRIAIAMACGWHGCTDVKCSYRKAQHLHKGVQIGFPESYSMSRYPDYVHDLNAMHSAEKTLETEKEICAYMENLTDASGGDTPVGQPSFCAYFATAAQRAEAFLKTKGLWKE